MSKDKIKEICKEIQKALGLFEWRLSYAWFDEEDSSKDGKRAAASMHTQPEYFEMRLSIYPAFFKEVEIHQFEILLHEFSHVLTEELYRAACAFAQGKNYHQDSLEQSRERNTTMVHLALLSLLASKENKLGKVYNSLAVSKKNKK